MNDLLVRPATGLAELVRAGEVSARELAEASLERIDATQPELNAFTLVDADGALAAADAIEPGDGRPFAGVPIAIKDLVASVAGLRLSQCSDFLGDYTPDYDAFVVRRIKDAGFVIVGKTNSPEFGILPVTEPRRFGPTRNPWDAERTPGGSSGGAAAAVAAGAVPVAHGSDGGGSIRIPAACCGLVGLKPSRGRISRGPDMGDTLLATDGALTRTVGDTAAMLDLLAGYELGDATWAPLAEAPFTELAGRRPERLRVALTTVPPLEVELDPVSERAARDAAELLSSLGHEVEEVTPPWTGVDMLPLFSQVWAGQISMGIAHGGMVRQREPTADDVEPLTWALYERAREVHSLDYLIAQAQLQGLARGIVAALWSKHDVVLTPALGQRPVPIGEIDACSDDPMDDFRRSGHFTPFTALWNVTGQPAISLPLFQGDDGLPLAVQLVGPPIGEGVLLSLAAQLEEAAPWAERRPAVTA